MRIPVPDGSPLGLAFGATPYPKDIKNPDGSDFGSKHAGQDFPVPTGTPVLSPEAGVVTQHPNYGDAGNMTSLVGDSGVVHRMLHQKSLFGNGRVKEGQQVGISDNTGLTTGPHVHWDVALNGKYIDPMVWLKSGNKPEDEMLNSGDSFNVTSLFGPGDKDRFNNQAWSAVFYNWLGGQVDQLKKDKVADDGVAAARYAVLQNIAKLVGDANPDDPNLADKVKAKLK